LRLSPSSVNSQPWHFVVASTSEGKARIAKAALPSNVNKVVDASHVFVLCTRHTLTDEYIDELLEQEARDGRFPTPEDRQARKQALLGYANKHRHVARDTHAWMEKQTYIALGFLLMGARQLGLDATPMEGFDTIALDRDLGLPERGFVSSVIVSVGHHGADDFNVKLPKSRFAADVLFTDI
ncbi:MAG: oxygen-insensitive NAD(P)H nitroreductase, partial [Gallionellaceae bacterium]|jgi:nitroreductase/dihydropteridine reductase|nr:oxygen-insensitive NAD(P)H nitroreductase [Gallionellaceae bacterium]